MAKKKNNARSGCIVLIAIVLVAIAGRGGSKSSNTASTPGASVVRSSPTVAVAQVAQRATNTLVALKTNTPRPVSTALATATTAEFKREREDAMSEWYLDKVDGITAVNVIVNGSVVYVEADVEQGKNTQAVAEELYVNAIPFVNEISDFTAILNDGSAVPVDYHRVGEEWTETMLNSVVTASSTQIPFTPQPGLAMTMEPSTYYASGGINLRDCPRTTCNIVDRLSAGESVIITGVINGESVNAGNAIWFKVDSSDEVYVYSGLVSKTPPVVSSGSGSSNNANSGSSDSTAPVATAPATSAAPVASRPGNCATAVAMGLSAEQAAQWPHLDRDKDGVACYGD